jgi:hypothetical protein
MTEGGRRAETHNSVHRPSWILDNLVSPYGLAAVSYSLFLFAWLLPPSIYSHYMKEPDIMFADPATFLLYTLCVASFVAGVWLIGFIFPTAYSDFKLKTRIPPTVFLLIPLLAGAAVAAASLISIFKRNPTILLLLFASQGEDIKTTLAIDAEVNFAFAPLALIAITWWAAWRLPELGIGGWKRKLVRSVLVAAVLVAMVSALLIMLRSLMMLALCGLAILYVTRKVLRKQINFKFAARVAAVMVLCVLGLFFLTAVLRGSDSWDNQVNTLFGYTIASYNRLAAVVDGRLRYPYAGHYLYLSSIVAHSHTLLISRFMIQPSSLDMWGSEFDAVSRAGLDGNLIWSGTFGYIFSDIGWFSLPFIFGYGVLYGIGWNWFKRGKVLGVVLYPFAGFCILFWIGSNYLTDAPMELVLGVAVILACYEFAFARREHAEG